MKNNNDGIYLERLKEKIEKKREELNELIIDGLKKEKVLLFSMELDELISEYHNLEKKCKKSGD